LRSRPEDGSPGPLSPDSAGASHSGKKLVRVDESIFGY
jgi:hypothetical protein